MKVSWRRGNFLKGPPFKDTWSDNLNRKYMVMKNTDGVQWAMVDSSEWQDDYLLAYVRRGKNSDGEDNELPEDGDVVTVAKNGVKFQFSVVQVYRNVGRARTVPMVIQPTE